jgi:hypothetical protein
MSRRNGRSARPVTVGNREKSFRRHIEALGIECADHYLVWCRRNGFPARRDKSARERRKEWETAMRLSALEAQAESLLRHVDALGLKSVAEYEAWCRAHGLGSRGSKSGERRNAELRVARAEAADSALAVSRQRARHPEGLIRQLAAGEPLPRQIQDPYLSRVAVAFRRKGLSTGSRQAFLDLILHTLPIASFRDAEPALPPFECFPGDTFVGGMYALAHYSRKWIRPLAEWQPHSRNSLLQFRSLARYLLARYDVPGFMDAAWFERDSSMARTYQEWFLHIGSGRNIRRADGLPLDMTERGAHFFLQAPPTVSIPGAMRWGQVRAMGGSEALANAVVATRIGERFTDEEFWVTVLHFFVNNPVLDTRHVRPIVDYVHHVRFGPVDGVLEVDGSFSMKGRTPAALLQRVRESHAALARQTRRGSLDFPASGIDPLLWMEPDVCEEAAQLWRVEEIRSVRDLYEEGRAMKHCVASYASDCASGRSSIWSMRVVAGPEARPQRVMTIEVNPKTRRVTEARGKCNQVPGRSGKCGRLNEGLTVLRRWAQQQDLTLAYLSE